MPVPQGRRVFRMNVKPILLEKVFLRRARFDIIEAQAILPVFIGIQTSSAATTKIFVCAMLMTTAVMLS